MGDRTQFGNELQRIAAHDAGAFPLVIAWGIALQRIERRYTDIAPALSDAEGQSLLGKSATAAPSYLRKLAGVVQDGRAHLKWYEQSGTLAFWPANTIRHDLNDNNLRMTNLIAPGSPTDTAVSNLTMALSDYRVNEANVLGDLADELLEEDRLITVNAALTTKTEDLNAVFDALAGLRQRVAQDDARFGDFQKAWHESVKQMDLAAWQVGGQGNDGGVTSFMTDAGDAPATLDAGDFSAWGIRPAIPVKKGDFISLHVSGEWTPSCALKHEFARIMGLTGIAASVTYGETSVRRSTFGKSAIRFSRRRGARSATRLCPRSTKPYRRRSPFWWLRGTVSLRRTGPTPRAPVPGRCRWS